MLLVTPSLVVESGHTTNRGANQEGRVGHENDRDFTDMASISGSRGAAFGAEDER